MAAPVSDQFEDYDPFYDDGSEELPGSMGGICIPTEHMCFPAYDISIPAYLNSASNYWGDGIQETVSRKNVNDQDIHDKNGTADGSGGGIEGTVSDDNQHSTSLLRRIKNWGSETLKKTSSQINLSLMVEDSSFTPLKQRTSFSCNDLKSLAHQSNPQNALVIDDAQRAAEERATDFGNGPRRVLFCCHGSRGDVQPLVALALEMKARGDEVAFWTVIPVNEFVERQGIQCYLHDLDTDDMMRRVQMRINKGVGESLGRGLGFFKNVTDVISEPDIEPKIDAIPDSVLAAHLKFRPQLTVTSHCMPAISCAELLHIPVIYIALQPMYPTNEFPPWAFTGTRVDGINWMNKTLGYIFMNIYENQTYAKGVKRCRKLAGLPVQRFEDGTPVYNLRFVPTATVISQHLVSTPADWPKWQKILGFLMMDGGREDIWTAPPELLAFFEEGPKPVYIGFGSMCGDEAMAVALTRTSLESLKQSNQRGILLGGWAGMTRLRLDPVADAELLKYAEKHIFELPACPHSWLFPKCAAVVHHGGAGTLAVGLRSGCPTIVCPFIFDQEYFGGLVETKKVGTITTPARDLSVEELSSTIIRVLNDKDIVSNAQSMGEQLRNENGIANTIDFINKAYTSFPYPWTVRVPNFKRCEPEWTDENFANFFDDSVVQDN